MKKSKLLNTLFVAVLTVALLVSSVPTQAFAATTMTESTFSSKLNTFKSSVYKHGSTYQDNSSGTLGWQCFGYANYLAKYIYGSFPTAKNVGSSVNSGWKITRDSSAIDNLHVGDIVRYRYKSSYYINHSIFITGIDGDTVYYTDANSDSENTVKWGNETTKAALKTNVAKYLSDQNGSLTSYKGFVAHYTNWQSTPVLSIKYHANGGTIPVTGTMYKVTEEVGVNMREGAGTGYDKIKTLAQGTTFTVNTGNTKTANGYTWGKTTVGDDTGWVVISDYVSKLASVGENGYYLNSSVVYRGSTTAALVAKLNYGETSATGVHNAATLGLSREGYTFLGWSLATEGGTVIDEDQALKPEEIDPDLKNGSKSVTLYAIWEENVPEHTHDYKAVVTAPTCTVDGYTIFTCACGDSYADEVVEALGHEYETAYFDAADGNPGYVLNSCVRCDEEYVSCDYAAKDGEETFATLQEALNAYESGNIQLQSDADSVTVTKDAVVDLNGFSIDSVTVTAGELTLLDSKTDDFTIADGDYGKIAVVSGDVKAADGYVAITEDDGTSFHKVGLETADMVLRGEDAGIYYNCIFSGDELVAKQVTTYGVALSVKGEPEIGLTGTAYSIFHGFVPGENTPSTYLKNVLKQTNTPAQNARNAELQVYGRAYIQIGDTYIYGKTECRSFRQQVELADEIWNELTADQKAEFTAMYRSFQDVMSDWNILNLKEST